MVNLYFNDGSYFQHSTHKLERRISNAGGGTRTATTTTYSSDNRETRTGVQLEEEAGVKYSGCNHHQYRASGHHTTTHTTEPDDHVVVQGEV